MPDSTSKYSYYDNLISSLSGDLDDLSVQKIQNTGDYLEESSDYDNNLFDKDSYYKALIDQQTEQKQSKEDGDLYGFIPGDWLPDWVKAGYNQSITGLAEQVATGDARFDLSDYEPGMLEDIGATVISFLQPADIGLMIAGGGIGGFAAKSATKAAVKKAIQQGVGKGVAVSDDLVKSIMGENIILSTGKTLAKKGKGMPVRVTTNPLDEAKRRLTMNGLSAKKASDIIDNAAPKVLNQAFQAAAVGGTQLGFYSGLQSSLGQIADPEQEFDLLMNIKNASKGAVLGAVTGATGPVVKTALKGLSPVTQTLAAKAVETAEFGTLAPIMEGELPTPEDYAHAAGVIGALGAQRYASGKLVKGYKKITQAKKDVKLGLDEGARLLGQIETETKIQPNEIFTDKNGVQIKDVRFDKRVTKKDQKKTEIGTEKVTLEEDIVRFRDVKTNQELNPIKFSTFQQRGFTRGGKGTPAELVKRRVNGIFSIKNNLKMKDATFRNRAGVITGRDLGGQNAKAIVKNMTPLEQLKMLNQMRHEARVIKLRDRIKSNGWETTMIPDKTLSDYHGIKFLDRSGKRLQTQLATDVKSRVDNADARYFTLMGTFSQRFTAAGLESAGMAKAKETVSTKAKEQAKQEAIELGRKLQDPNFKNNPKVIEYRKILEDMWDIAQRAGVNLGPKEDFYFPRVIKQDILKVLSKDLGKLRDENPQLFTENAMFNKPEFQKVVGDIVAKGKLSNDTLNIIYEMAGIRRDLAREQVPDFNLKVSQAFKTLNRTVNSQYHNVASHLEIARKAKELPEYMLETDARIVLAKYTHQWARRVSSVEQFGRKGEFWQQSISQLRELAQNKNNKYTEKETKVFAQEADVLDKLYKIYSNNIELDPSYNWKSAGVRRAWREIVDFEIGTKIGLGFATVPNLTQLSISTAVKTGYYPVIKGMYKLSTSSEYRKLIKQSGVTNISLYQTLAGLNPSDSFMGKFAEGATWLSGFKKINEINQLVSSAAAKEWIDMLQPIAQGKGTGRFKARRNWARQNLRDMGVTDINNITNRQKSESMYKFARDTQLQRNILEEPLVFNDPRFRPFVLFKKFGYKQFNWIRGQLGAELKRGNIFPMLRLASAGLFGGELVTWARDKLAEVYAGQEVYDENEYFLDFGNLKDVAFGDKKISSLLKTDRMTWGDVLDRFASVGAMGVAMDIVAAENTIRALEFAGKPAVLQDLSKIWLTMTKTWENIGEYGGIGALQRMPKYLAPALGTVPRRLAERIEPAGQRKTYVKYRKGLTRSKILDHIIEGNDIKATRLIKNWNKTFPENPILYDDVSVDAITKRIISKAKKKANP
tara:strand:- start:72 stop:4055 length:3984 start_codon:yes stop_codon:yes gene_type:complete